MLTALIVLLVGGAIVAVAVFVLVMSIGTFVYAGVVRFEITLTQPFAVDVYAKADDAEPVLVSPLALTGSFEMEGGFVIFLFLDSGPKRAALTVYTRAPENPDWPWASHTLRVRLADGAVESADAVFAGIRITSATVRKTGAKRHGQWVYEGEVRGACGA